MPTYLTEDQFGELFASFKQEAFRLETLDSYAVPEEDQEFKSYLEGAERPADAMKDWVALIHRAAVRGAEMRRVRVVSLPLSDYVRFEIEWGYDISDPAGEHVTMADRKDFPVPSDQMQDFWLFDGATLVRMVYGSDGKFLGGEKVADQASVDRFKKIRELAVNHSQPYREFLKLHSTEDSAVNL